MSDDGVFERSVLELLREGLHIRRGLTAEEYIALCQKAWDACETSPDFPRKVLLDPLRPAENYLLNSSQDYIHFRAIEALESQPRESTDIRCTAVGLVKADFSMEREGDDPAVSEDSDVPEIRRYILGVFDVLGFSALIGSRSLKEVTSLYERLIAEAVTKEAVRTFGIIRLNDRESATTMFALPVRHTHFSDTIILWVPLVQHFIAPFIGRCSGLVCEALKMGLPLRGALAVGPAVLHSGSGTFVGQPIVEAARLEQAQNWLGVSLGLSMLASDVSREFDPNFILPYDAPVKPRRKHLSSGLALDWPRRMVTHHNSDPREMLQSLNTSPAHRRYYDNATKFVEFSRGPILRREGMQPAHLSELAAAAVAARTAGSHLDKDQESVLRDLKRVGFIGSSVAEFVDAIAKGQAAPEIPAELPAGLRRYLRELSLASQGTAKYFKLSELVVQALYARLQGSELSKDTLDALAELEAFGRRGASAAKFVRDLATGGSTDIPRGLPKEMKDFLGQARDWASGKVPRGPMQHLANECLRVRVLGGVLSRHDLTMMNLLEASGHPWPSVAAFLRDVADATKSPRVPADLPESVERNLTRMAHAASVAMVQSPRLLELISIGFGDPSTGIDLFALVHLLVQLKGSQQGIPKELEPLISKFETAAPERAVIGQHLRALVTGAPPIDVPPKLPIALELFLIQMRAVADGKPIPLDPRLVGWAAIRSRHGGGDIGDCLGFSLCAMLSANAEFKTLAQYFRDLARGRPAAPAPEFSAPELTEVAQEMRCLADRAVGGFRLLMSPANQAQSGALEKS